MNGDGFDSLDRIVASATGEQAAPEKRSTWDRASDHHEQDFRPFMESVRMADVKPEPVEWVWPERIPLGKLSLIVGNPGMGKSFVTLDLAARLSSGSGWPDRPHERIEPGSTVILSAEDDPADTIRPRLDAAKADVSRIYVVRGVVRAPDSDPTYPTLEHDIPELDALIEKTEAKLLIVDPISAYLGQRDGHSNTDIRGVLGPLAELAGRQRCAVVCVTHVNKSAAMQAIYRAIGSIAFVAAARIAWLIGEDQDDETGRRRLMLPLKSNLIEKPSGLAFSIEDGRVCWEAAPVTDIDPDMVLSNDSRGRKELTDAMDFLTGLLVRGPLPVRELQDAATADGHSWRTVNRAKAKLGVVSTREGFGKHGRFVWALPDAPEAVSA